MDACVIGLGYIGLPTALMLAANGIKVTAVDVNRELVGHLKDKGLTFEEKGLYELFRAAVPNICFQHEYPKKDIYIIAVPTPYMPESKKVDPQYIISATESVLSVCGDDAIIVVESTVSPGTIDRFIRPIVSKAGRNICLAHAPERVIPGNIVYELTNNSRTIGSDDPATGETLKSLYSSFCYGEIILTDIRTAEMTKVVENTFRDINIAFANELAKICHQEGMDVYEIIRIANKHPRVNILSPGPGVGGHCISVDPWFLVGEYPDLAQLIYTARTVNDSMPEYVLEHIYEIMNKNGISDLSRVGLYGLTYKENVDDTRESPTLQLLDVLEHRQCGGMVQVYDPYIIKKLVSNQHASLQEFLDSIDMVVILVAHNEIKEQMEKLKGKTVYDTRSCSSIQSAYKL